MAVPPCAVPFARGLCMAYVQHVQPTDEEDERDKEAYLSWVSDKCPSSNDAETQERRRQEAEGVLAAVRDTHGTLLENDERNAWASMARILFSAEPVLALVGGQDGLQPLKDYRAAVSGGSAEQIDLSQDKLSVTSPIMQVLPRCRASTPIRC